MSQSKRSEILTAFRGRGSALALAIATLATFNVIEPALATTSVFNNRTMFEGTLADIVVDDYEHPSYQVGDRENSSSFHIHSNVSMSAVLGETKYTTTGWEEHNIIFLSVSGNNFYCAGCNGSYLLDFTETSVGTSNGVFGVGLDVVSGTSVFGTHAFVTYGDENTQDFPVPQGGAFWGITSDLSIKSIHFGLANGGTNTDNSVQRMAMDNLTIGAKVPEPGGLALVGILLGAVITAFRRRG